MRITLSMSDTPHRDTLTVYADKRDAKADGSILGSRWETPNDMDVGYAMIDNFSNVEARLAASGYRLSGESDEILPVIKSCSEAHCNDPHCPWKDA